MDNQIQLKKELKILGFLIEMRKCYLEGKHKKNRYILARKYKVGNVPMSIIEKQIKNEITEKSVDDFIKECREFKSGRLMTTQRKNFDRAYRLHAACAISEVQPELAYITFRKGFAYASDGHMAARAKVETIATGFHPDELQRLEGKTIHMDNFRRLLNYAVANVTEQGFEVNDQGRRLLIYFAEQQTIMFDREMTDIFDTCTMTNSMQVYKIGISANQLRKASQVIGTDRLCANFFANDGNQRIYIHLTGIQQTADIDIVIYDQIM